jgi:chromosome segregation ATPase
VVERLKAEVVELIDELRQMHSRQDLLLAEQDRFQDTIRDLENTVDLHKRRYEAAKTELRDLKREQLLTCLTPLQNTQIFHIQMATVTEF